jgi:hypothetical protein
MEDEIFDGYMNSEDPQTKKNFKDYIIDSEPERNDFDIKHFLSLFGGNFRIWRMKQGKLNS